MNNLIIIAILESHIYIKFHNVINHYDMEALYHHHFLIDDNDYETPYFMNNYEIVIINMLQKINLLFNMLVID